MNPTPFTIVTFPFLFAVMFGDIAHGSMLLFLGTFLVLFAKWRKIRKVARYRYIIFLMGFFSVFTGFIYNDFTSIPLELFSTCTSPTCMYPFGVDYKWYDSKNMLSFMNSMKMKIAVILGVAQMTLGILLKAVNSIKLNRPLDFFFEFIP